MNRLELGRHIEWRDLLDLTKDNIQIKESKVQEILLSGSYRDPEERFDAMHKETDDNAGVLLKISGMIRECHSSTGNFYRIVSDSAKYCNEHVDFESDFAPF
ncbi:hypothetical protein NC651_029776 [Populus alba x Populus x berolinensis]|nr:hypothetical protein NC651_029776 [Populus alba x Populus x berolinensis]